jgi:carbohydrate kinase (thermoresistant glucokinase family)
MIIIVMGVSGSGKTTVGRLLAAELGLPFHDADDFHADESVEKMRSGRALDDEDRRMWLEDLARRIARWSHESGAVLACSALKRSYREVLISRAPEGKVVFVHLKGRRELIRERLELREGHYMPVELLDSQFESLDEPPDAMVVAIDRPPPAIVQEIISALPQK